MFKTRTQLSKVRNIIILVGVFVNLEHEGIKVVIKNKKTREKIKSKCLTLDNKSYYSYMNYKHKHMPYNLHNKIKVHIVPLFFLKVRAKHFDL